MGTRISKIRIREKIAKAMAAKRRDHQFGIAYDAWSEAVKISDRDLEEKSRRIMDHGNE